MKHMKKLLGLVLAGALMVGVLAGCGEKTTTPDPDDIAYQTAGISRDTVLLTVDGADVTADEYLFWLVSAVTQAQQNGYLTADEDWSGEIEGVPAVEYVKSNALETAKLYSLLESKAAEAGITLSEEKQADADAYMEQMTMYLSLMGYDSLQEYLDCQCITEETFTKFNEMYYLSEVFVEKLMAEGDERVIPTEDEMAAFLSENGIYRCQHILLAFPENEDGSAVTDEQKAQTLAETTDLLTQIRVAADPAAKFEELMHAHSDDGRDSAGELYKPEGYTFLESGYLVDGSTMLVTEFVDAGIALAEGEISEPVETTYGYHILMRCSADTEETRTAYANYSMNDIIDQWVQEAEVKTTEAYVALDPKSFYANLTTRNQEWAAEKQAQAEADAAATATPSAEPEDVIVEPTDEPVG